MKINIAASHRFHMLDLARELHSLGHEVRFYSYVPYKRLQSYGIKSEKNNFLYFLSIPFLIIEKISRNSFWSTYLKNIFLDTYVAYFMEPCDVFIGIGYVYKKSFISAKNKYNAIAINDWGSKHNEIQWRILSKVPSLKPQPKYYSKRLLEAYDLADYIAVPSMHVYQGFIDKGFCKDKLLLNPYGVELSQFYPTELSKEKHYDLIIVGTWSYVKGCDLLINFLKQSELTLLHVGSIGNIDFPTDMENITHIESVDQKELVKYYSMAKIFVLPSRTEGFGMVLSQALVCGLPIVCSKNTGGPDLRNMLTDKKWIVEMDEFSIVSLESSILEALKLADSQLNSRNYAKNIFSLLTWSAYGKRYDDSLKNIFKSIENE